jgi:DNA-binding YbaB/EbfC family protein
VDIQYLMRQAKKLEKAMADAREKLGELAVGADSGGGLVKVAMNGKCEITKLTIDPRALGEGGPPDLAMVEDLVTAAVNAAAEKARAAADEHMQKASGGIKIPGIAG